MAIPRGQFGNRLDTEAGRAKEQAMAAAAAAAAAGNSEAIQMAQAASNNAAFRQAVASTLEQNTPRQQSTPQEPTLPPGNTPSEVQAQADAAAAARDAAARAAQAAIDAANEARRQQNAIATLKATLESLNMNSLYDRVVGFVKEGYDPDAVMVLIRTTPEYKTRFPAMEALAKKGRSISESEYISYEQTAAGLERRYGLPSGMLMSNVTNLLTNEVSASELNDRVLLASAAAIQAPEDIKSTFQQYYGIDQGGLTAYFLDPTVATPLLEKRYASAVIGTEAARQGIGINPYTAENLQSLGISQEQARTGFANVAASQGFTEGRGDIVTQDTLIQGQVAGSEQARKDIERVAMGRLGRFQGGGEFLQTQQGVVGLGTAATR